MLHALLHTASVSALLGLAACQFSSAPNRVGSVERDDDERATGGKSSRFVAVATGGTRARDAGADAESASSSDAEASEDSAAGAGGQRSPSTNNAGSGGAKAPQDDPPPAADPGQSAPADAGPVSPADAAVGDAAVLVDGAVVDGAVPPTVENPDDVLTELGRRSPGTRTAETINKFLEALAKGDTPASSINDFLMTIDSEVDCGMNPWATECLAACQTVSTVCYICVLNEECRTTMLGVCGVTALAGCTRR
jgi:hypothetical protein